MAEHFSVAPGRWCLFTRFSPCQCEKAPFIGKQHTLVPLLQMTHILKPRLFECRDMRHRYEAPQTQRDTSWVNERPRSGGFVSLSPLSPPLADQKRKKQVRVERARLRGRKRRRRVNKKVRQCRQRAEDGMF